MKEKFIYLVSDGTAITCERLLEAAFKQFTNTKIQTKKFPQTRTVDDADKIIEQCEKDNAFIMYTTVIPEVRLALQIGCIEKNIASIDVLGPIVAQLSNLLDIAPLSEPGLMSHSQTQAEKMEAVAYSIQHDDGLNCEKISDADILILGIPGTLKTPISMYLACKGFRIANLPVIAGENISCEISKIDKSKIVGLTVDFDTLKTLRSHLKDRSSDYSNENLKKEIEYATEIFTKFGIKTIPITGKSIESLAGEIVKLTQKPQQ